MERSLGGLVQSDGGASAENDKDCWDFPRISQVIYTVCYEPIVIIDTKM